MRIKKTENGWIVYVPYYFIPTTSPQSDSQTKRLRAGDIIEWTPYPKILELEKQYVFSSVEDLLSFIREQLSLSVKND